jgi:hypothetical protein
MEFSGVFDICINPKNNVYHKYFLFIKYNDLIYIDIKNIGSIIIPFVELIKNNYLKMYYDLSILLVKNKNQVIEVIRHEKQYERRYNNLIYKEEREWFVNSAYFVEDFSTKIKSVRESKIYIYYNINPNDLRQMIISSTDDIVLFYKKLEIRYGYEQGRGFKNLVLDYTNLMLDFNIKLIEENMNEISFNQEDDKNVINLLELNKKEGMNADIFQILYSNIIGSNKKPRIAKYIKI